MQKRPNFLCHLIFYSVCRRSVFEETSVKQQRNMRMFSIFAWKINSSPCIYMSFVWVWFTLELCLYSILLAINWIGLRKLKELDVSDNCLTSLPLTVMHCLKSLSILKVCRNKLSTFPDPWACPLVRNQNVINIWKLTGVV